MPPRSLDHAQPRGHPEVKQGKTSRRCPKGVIFSSGMHQTRNDTVLSWLALTALGNSSKYSKEWSCGIGHLCQRFPMYRVGREQRHKGSELITNWVSLAFFPLFDFSPSTSYTAIIHLPA